VITGECAQTDLMMRKRVRVRATVLLDAFQREAAVAGAGERTRVQRQQHGIGVELREDERDRFGMSSVGKHRANRRWADCARASRG
jgi:hypothetical protein